jgi:hypothetical protein
MIPLYITKLYIMHTVYERSIAQAKIKRSFGTVFYQQSVTESLICFMNSVFHIFFVSFPSFLCAISFNFFEHFLYLPPLLP